jgi:hypothetical protein
MRKANGNIDITLNILGDQFVEPNASEEAGTNSCGMTIASQSNNWHSHPKGLACRRGAVIRERIKRYVDLAVMRKLSCPIGGPSQQRNLL